jgi:coatomer subunit beta
VKVTIKVSSTETSHIFGNIVFDTSSNTDTTVLNLNDINIDIMDYIRPASASDVMFRSMWAEFEWENKVACNTDISNVQDFVNHIVKITNMKCLTPTSALGGECNFLAANLYAKR